MVQQHPIKGPNRFKLGVFSANADGGLAITDVAERWRARWDDNLAAVGIADRAGLEFFLPIARWRGFGGKNHVREWSFEILFSTFSNIEDGRGHVADIRTRAQQQGRDVGIYTVCHVVARETQREADEYYERYAVTLADHGAVDNHMAQKKEFANSHDKSAFDLYRKRFAGGAGTYPLLVGSRVSFECEVSHVHEWATHHIVIGSVLDVHFSRIASQSLVYADGAYHAVG